MAEPLITLSDAGKEYTKFEDAPMLVSAALRFRARTTRSTLWAVRHVDFEVAPGECFGVIGRNGSGKSTLLQMLAGVTAPTEGRVQVRGKVAPLISVGVGFHPELTGRENVYVNAAILGLSRREVNERFDEIVDFADIGPFIDTPVKFYSSGMFVRLGFAVAINVNPSVLLIDEILAVGDMAFQMKCFDKMTEIRNSGATVVVVSHNLNAIRRMCDRTMVLHLGEQRFTGSTTDAVSLFHQMMGETRDLDVEDDDEAGFGRGVAKVESWSLVDAAGTEHAYAEPGDQLTFVAEVSFAAAMKDPVFAFSITSERGAVVYGEGSYDHRPGSFEAGDRTTVRIHLTQELATGSYKAQIGVVDRELDETIAAGTPIHFYAHGRNMVRGLIDLGGSFAVEDAPERP